MTIEEIHEYVMGSDDYQFLEDNKHLGSSIILLGLGGSYAYGMNTETSDVDVRGCALPSAKEILLMQPFEQVSDEKTDTVIYSFPKLISLLAGCNPNVIEMLGLRPEHYIYLSDAGQALVDNADMFLSRRAFYAFGGYAQAQLRRLDNKAVRTLEQREQEQHILNSIKNAAVTFPEKYFAYDEDAIRLYLDDAYDPEMDKEIFMDVTLRHYPLRDYKAMWSEMNNVVKDYAKLGKRNAHAAEHGKLAKHMAHLVRLHYMAFDILEEGKIVTYREKEHDLLMSIRNGAYLTDDDRVRPEFFELVDELAARLERDKELSVLPKEPDWNRINRFAMEVNADIVQKYLEEVRARESWSDFRKAWDNNPEL